MANIKNYFIPRYDELTLYLHGVSFVMLVALNSDFRFFFLSLTNESLKAVIIKAIVFIGAFFSIFNALVQRKKSDFEKMTMLMFAIFSNLYVSIYALDHQWDAGDQPLGLSQYVAMFNFLYTLLLMVLLRTGAIDDSSISDEDVPYCQVMVVTIPIVLVYLFCQFILNASWYTTYSWCVFVSLISKEILRFISTEVLFYRGTVANKQNNVVSRKAK
jgi:hypothetical protein